MPRTASKAIFLFQFLAAVSYLPAYGYNHFHNILRLFDVLSDFPSIKSETKRGY